MKSLLLLFSVLTPFLGPGQTFNLPAEYNLSPNVAFYEKAEFLISDTLLAKYSRGDANLIKKKGLESSDAIWFKHRKSGQLMVVEIHTDYCIMGVTNFVPAIVSDTLLRELGLYRRNNEDLYPTITEIKNALPALTRKAKGIGIKHFSTKHGIRLGDNKDSIINVYGTADRVYSQAGIEVHEWDLYGTYLLREYGYYLDTLHVGVKRAVKGERGQVVKLFFKDNILIGQVHNNSCCSHDPLGDRLIHTYNALYPEEYKPQRRKKKEE